MLVAACTRLGVLVLVILVVEQVRLEAQKVRRELPNVGKEVQEYS